MNKQCKATACNNEEGYALESDGCVHCADVDKHINGNVCESNDVFNCGKHGRNCYDAFGTGVKEVACNSGTCQLVSCDSDAGYVKSSSGNSCGTCNSVQHAYNDNCEADSDEHCGRHGNACSGERHCNSESKKCCTIDSTTSEFTDDCE